MKLVVLLVPLLLLAGPVAAEADAGLAAIHDLGRVNGQGLACRQMAVSAQAKALMLKHAPKARRYGEAFEEATNAAFLAQGKEDGCPQSAELTGKLGELASRLQTTLPPAP